MKFDELATRYTGGLAHGYEAERTGGPEWPREQAIVERFLGLLPRGVTLLDVPVGTGRFLPFYKACDLRVTGLDISLDMLAKARSKAAALGLDIALAKGDIRKVEARRTRASRPRSACASSIGSISPGWKRR